MPADSEARLLGMGKRTAQVCLLWIITSASLLAYYDSFQQTVPHQQFYPTLVRMNKNSQAMILAWVHWLAFSYLLTKVLIKVFLGELRAIEVENVQGNFWLSLTDIALTLMIFHRETESAPVSFVMLLRPGRSLQHSSFLLL